MRIIDPMKAFMPVGGNKTDQSYGKLRDLLPLEIVKGFCDADDICYGNMHPKISWIGQRRSATAMKFCDFKVHIKEN